MKVFDAVTVITTITLTLGAMSFIAQEDLADRNESLKAAAERGRVWMEETTTKLDQIQAGVEQVTGDTVQLSKQVEAMADRMDEAGI